MRSALRASRPLIELQSCFRWIGPSDFTTFLRIALHLAHSPRRSSAEDRPFSPTLPIEIFPQSLFPLVNLLGDECPSPVLLRLLRGGGFRRGRVLMFFQIPPFLLPGFEKRELSRLHATCRLHLRDVFLPLVQPPTL